MIIIIKTMSGENFSLDVEKNITVSILKDKIEAIKKIDPRMQRLIFQGSPMINDYQLDKYNIKDNSIIHLILSMM
jgi:hypothetical protein